MLNDVYNFQSLSASPLERRCKTSHGGGRAPRPLHFETMQAQRSGRVRPFHFETMQAIHFDRVRPFHFEIEQTMRSDRVRPFHFEMMQAVRSDRVRPHHCEMMQVGIPDQMGALCTESWRAQRQTFAWGSTEIFFLSKGVARSRL